MWHRRIPLSLVTMILATVGALHLWASPALAGYRGDPIIADINGDGLPERILLAVTEPTGCAVVIEIGVRQDVFYPPEVHPYPIPLGLPNEQCPDIGTAADLDGDGRVELVVGWFAGRPPGHTYDLLVLDHTIEPVSTALGLDFPSFMGTADFNGDGRQDIYEWSDQAPGFASFLNNGNNTITPGPVRWCARPLQVDVRDFNHNGAADVAISYIEHCGDLSNGVVVILDDGTVRQLEFSGSEDIVRPLFHEAWNMTVVDANGDGAPDVRTVDQATGVVHVFINNGSGEFVLAPVANNDVAVIRGDKRTAIPVLANDVASTGVKITIVTPPRYGRAQVTSSGTIVYTPYAGHPNRDRFVYRLTQDGRSDNAAVTIRFTS